MGSVFWFVVGYCVCVLVPVPGISRFIIDTWAKAWGWVLTKTRSTPPGGV